MKFKAPARHHFFNKFMEMCLIIIYMDFLFILIVCDNINRITSQQQ